MMFLRFIQCETIDFLFLFSQIESFLVLLMRILSIQYAHLRLEIKNVIKETRGKWELKLLDSLICV